MKSNSFRNFNLSLILIVVIIISIGFSALVAAERYSIERDYKNVEIAVFHNEVLELASLIGENPIELFRELKGKGVTTVSFKEDTPRMLIDRGDLLFRTGIEARALYRSQYPDVSFKPGLNYLITYEQRNFDRVKEIMEAKGLSISEHGTFGPIYYLATPLTSEFLTRTGLGFPFPLINEIEAMGYYIQIQPRDWPDIKYSEVENVFSTFKRIPNLTGILFNTDVPGFQNLQLLEKIAVEFKNMKIPLVQIEFMNQKGITSLSRLMHNRVVRLHTISQNEMLQYSTQRAVERYNLAVTDRNIRVALVRFITEFGYSNLKDVNLNLVEKVTESVINDGYTLGRANPPGTLRLSTLSLFFIGLGVIAGGLMILTFIFPQKYIAPLGIAGALIWLVASLLTIIGPTWVPLIQKLMALGAVSVFPTLALIWGIQRERLTIGGAVKKLLQISAISFIGVFLMVGLLADTSFMLKIDQFFGVKLAHLIPLVVVVLYVIYKVPDQDRSFIEQVKEHFNSPLTIGIAVAGAIMVAVLAVYILRTGNTDVGAVIPFEVKLRALLDRVLFVRPRTKEFLIGHPFLLLLLYLGYKKNLLLPLVVLATIGQVSMVNTFAHIHTPLVISLVRNLNGLWLGILIGLILITAYEVINKTLVKFQQSL